MGRKIFLMLWLSITMISTPTLASNWSQVMINGQQLTSEQLAYLEQSIGSRIPAGAYLLNNDGCWVNLQSGASGCIGKVDTFSRHGSGERTSDGSWNHWSNSAEMGVGGTADGCVYTTTGWSNC